MLARRVGGSEGKIRHDLVDASLSGLTAKGRAYVKHARTPAWRKIVNRLKKSGQEVTTALLLEST